MSEQSRIPAKPQPPRMGPLYDKTDRGVILAGRPVTLRENGGGFAVWASVTVTWPDGRYKTRLNRDERERLDMLKSKTLGAYKKILMGLGWTERDGLWYAPPPAPPPIDPVAAGILSRADVLESFRSAGIDPHPWTAAMLARSDSAAIRRAVFDEAIGIAETVLMAEDRSETERAALLTVIHRLKAAQDKQ